VAKTVKSGVWGVGPEVLVLRKKLCASAFVFVRIARPPHKSPSSFRLTMLVSSTPSSSALNLLSIAQESPAGPGPYYDDIVVHENNSKNGSVQKRSMVDL